MRGTRAKQLRRAAQRATVGKPARAYRVKEYTRAVTQLIPGEDGELVPTRVPVTRRQLLLTPESTRRVYQDLKRWWRARVTNGQRAATLALVRAAEGRAA